MKIVFHVPRRVYAFHMSIICLTVFFVTGILCNTGSAEESYGSNEYLMIIHEWNDKQIVNIFDVNAGEILNLSTFVNKPNSPSKPPKLPCLMDDMFTAWFSFNFDSVSGAYSFSYDTTGKSSKCLTNYNYATSIDILENNKAGPLPHSVDYFEEGVCQQDPLSHQLLHVKDVRSDRYDYTSLWSFEKYTNGVLRYLIHDHVTSEDYLISISEQYSVSRDFTTRTKQYYDYYHHGVMTSSSKLSLEVNDVKIRDLFHRDYSFELTSRTGAPAADYEGTFGDVNVSGGHGRAMVTDFSSGSWGIAVAGGEQYIITLLGGVFTVGENLAANQEIDYFYWDSCYLNGVGTGNHPIWYSNGSWAYMSDYFVSEDPDVWIIPTVTRISSDNGAQHSIIEAFNKSIPEKEIGLENTVKQLLALAEDIHSDQDLRLVLKVRPSIVMWRVKEEIPKGTNLGSPGNCIL